MDKKATGVVAYLSWIGFLVAYLAGDREGAKFHINQGAVLAIINVAVSVISGVSFLIPFGGYIIGAVNVAWLIFTVMGIVGALNDEEKPLPLIGGIIIIK